MRCSLIALCAGLPMAAPVVAQDLIELDPISVEAEADQDAPPTTAVISAEQMETQYQGAPLGTVAWKWLPAAQQAAVDTVARAMLQRSTSHNMAALCDRLVAWRDATVKLPLPQIKVAVGADAGPGASPGPRDRPGTLCQLWAALEAMSGSEAGALLWRVAGGQLPAGSGAAGFDATLLQDNTFRKLLGLWRAADTVRMRLRAWLARGKQLRKKQRRLQASEAPAGAAAARG